MKRISLYWRFSAYAASTILLIFATWQTVFHSITFGIYDKLPLPVIILAGTALLILGYYLAITGSLQRKSTLAALNAVATIGLVAITFLLIGILQDLIGMECRGFFGVQQSCLASWSFSAAVTFLNPLVYLLTLVIPSVLVLIELTSGNRVRNKKR